MSAPSEGTRLATLCVIITLYITLNSSLNLLNRYALGISGFKFPMVLTSTHMAFCFVALLPYHLAHGWGVHKAKLQQQWKGLAAIGAFLACGISLNNISLVYITLSLNQVIRSSIPVVACALSVVVQGSRPTRLEAASLVVLTLGVMLAVWEGSVAGQPIGVLFCMLGTLSSGAMVTFSGKLLSEQLDVLSLAFFTAPVSLLCLTPFVAANELPKFSAYLATATRQSVGLLVLASSANALAYNILHYLMIQRTSAVATAVVGEVKIVGLLVLSALLLGEGRQFTLRMTAGCALALGGFCMYSHAKLGAYRSQQLRASTHVVEAAILEAADPIAGSGLPVQHAAQQVQRQPESPLPAGKKGGLLGEGGGSLCKLVPSRVDVLVEAGRTARGPLLTLQGDGGAATWPGSPGIRIKALTAR